MGETVSVVIPCYNQAHFLGEAIESVLVQTYRPFEIVVVDDGATDNTAEVAARYPGVRCVRQANQGLPAARNAGLGVARGAYVVFLDADDRLLPAALEAGAACLERHPEAAFVVGQRRRIAADGTPLPVPTRPRVEGDHYVSLVRSCWITMPAMVMYRRAALDRVGGFDATQRYAEDYELYLRMTRHARIVDHYTEVAEHRQHPGTQSRNAERMLAATLRALRPHRPGPEATPEHRAAYHARDNAVYYYDRLLEKITDDLRHRRWLMAARSIAILLRYLPEHPGYVRRHLGTPFRLAARALPRRGAPS